MQLGRDHFCYAIDFKSIVSFLIVIFNLWSGFNHGSVIGHDMLIRHFNVLYELWKNFTFVNKGVDIYIMHSKKYWMMYSIFFFYQKVHTWFNIIYTMYTICTYVNSYNVCTVYAVFFMVHIITDYAMCSNLFLTIFLYDLIPMFWI